MKTIKESSGSRNRHPVDILESEYPLMTDEFKRLQRIQYETFCRKQLDYGPGNIAVGTQSVSYTHLTLPTICSV